jgi:hypothetical protein
VPSLNGQMILKVAQDMKAFLNVEMGFTRGSAPDPATIQRELRRVQKRLQKRNRQVTRMRRSLQNKDRRIARLRNGSLGAKGSDARAENIIWIFGTGRSGSTWLMNMMANMPRTSSWNEPMVGGLFGKFYHDAQVGQRNARGFILGEPAREGWIPLIREFVLGSIDYRFPRFGPQDFLVVKEPNASVGASILMEALPESRMILLMRDPRDVVASMLDAMRKGSWLYERKDRGRQGKDSFSDTDPDAAVESRAQVFLRDVSNARSAFDAHKGHKALVRYEDLRASTLDTLKRVYSALEIPLADGDLEETVEKYRWESIPEEEKGQGKKFRKATPGGWYEDLTPAQAKMVEQITAPLLERFYDASASESQESSSSP